MQPATTPGPWPTTHAYACTRHSPPPDRKLPTLLSAGCQGKDALVSRSPQPSPASSLRPAAHTNTRPHPATSHAQPHVSDAKACRCSMHAQDAPNCPVLTTPALSCQLPAAIACLLSSCNAKGLWAANTRLSCCNTPHLHPSPTPARHTLLHATALRRNQQQVPHSDAARADASLM
jgi:hypothetical protein